MSGLRRARFPFVAMLMVSLATSADTVAPGSAEAIDPLELIAARQALMLSSEELMQPIDSFTVDDSIDRETMRTNARSIAAMLLAVPPLFPDGTDLYDADADLPVTLALPSVWENFEGFYGLAQAASALATALAETYDEADLREASLGLRGACDACHALYLLPYEEPEIKQPDEDFDFEFGR